MPQRRLVLRPAALWFASLVSVLLVVASAGPATAGGPAGAGVTAAPGVTARASAFDGSIRGRGLQLAESATNGSGAYSLRPLPPGRYRLRFFRCLPSGPLAPTGLTGVSLGVNQVLTGVDIVLRLGGSIGGVVATSGPGAGICAEAMPVAGRDIAGVAVTGPGGGYRIEGLPAGEYQVLFTPLCATGAAPSAPGWFGGGAVRSGAPPVTIRLGVTTSGIDATSAADGGISGTVTTGGSAPLAGACVTAVPSAPVATGAADVVAVTGATGTYSIGDLIPGTYTVEFSSGCGATGYVTQWWDGAASPGAATAVSVDAGAVSTGISAVLTK